MLDVWLSKWFSIFFMSDNPKFVWTTQRTNWVVLCATRDFSWSAALWGQIDGLVQDCSNSSALAMELRLSCTNPSKYQRYHVVLFSTLWKITIVTLYRNCLYVCRLPQLLQNYGGNGPSEADVQGIQTYRRHVQPSAVMQTLSTTGPLFTKR